MASDEVARLQTALVLFDDGVELMRCNLRRRHPTRTTSGSSSCSRSG